MAYVRWTVRTGRLPRSRCRFAHRPHHREVAPAPCTAVFRIDLMGHRLCCPLPCSASSQNWAIASPIRSPGFSAGRRPWLGGLLALGRDARPPRHAPPTIPPPVGCQDGLLPSPVTRRPEPERRATSPEQIRSPAGCIIDGVEV